jgi:ribonucleoside-triphosphate reductase
MSTTPASNPEAFPNFRDGFHPDTAPEWGPSGETVYTRTYQREHPDGTRETWAETVDRVVRGNLSLVDPKHIEPNEYERLCNLIHGFKIMPAGRHLWASGVAGRQYLFNCHVSGWGALFSDHFRFTFMRLMEGGGVGANYSSRFLKPYGVPKRPLTVHVVCDPAHPDYPAMKAAGVLSDAYSPEWPGAFEVGDSREGWAAAMVDLMETYWADDVKHTDRVYDVSNVRERGRRLKTFGGYASGPEPLARLLGAVADTLNAAAKDDGWDYVTPLRAMDIDHAIAECVVSGGNRRSARMAILEWDDAHIFEFLKCKANPAKHWTTNISVAVDDEFSRQLTMPGDPTGAKAVHKAVVTGMLKNGEPGYWNRSLSQQGETGEVIATNPCGEITLEAWENCNLGHVNLAKFVDDRNRIDWHGAIEAHRLMSRFLIRATYGDVTDPWQAERLAANRRIGVGHFGVQGFLAKQGIRFTDAPKFGEFREFLRGMQGAVRRAANEYAFQLRIPTPVKVTTVAPTGTIAKLSGDTEGIHPIYARYFERRIRFSMSDPTQVAQLEQYEREGFVTEKCIYAPNTWVVVIPTRERLVDDVTARGYDAASVVQSADEISLRDMLNMQAIYQEYYADNAVSFTVNVPEGVYTVDDTMGVLGEFLPRLKGTTLMPDGTRAQAPYTRITAEQYADAAAKVVADSVDEECATGACPVR